MAILKFPPVESADENGFLAIGGDLEVSSLVLAYRSGIFPWPHPGVKEIPWFSPDPRALLFFSELHIPKRLTRYLRTAPFEIRFNERFEEVIEQCARSKNRKQLTWIRRDMRDAYLRLHQAGHAHSIEAYRKGKLVGGLYGVAVGKAFAGESMFYHEPHASKAALLATIDLLKDQGAEWLDCQMLTPHLEALGAREIPRAEYIRLLKAALHLGELSFGPVS